MAVKKKRKPGRPPKTEAQKKRDAAKKAKEAAKRKPNDIKTGEYKPTKEVFKVYEDAQFGHKLEVRNSGNAWWVKDWDKVDKLITGYKLSYNWTENIFYAGVTRNQYYYFLEIHPEFKEYFEHCKQYPNLLAKKTIIENLKDPMTAKWWAEKKMRDEFHEKRQMQINEIDDEVTAETYRLAALELQNDKK